MGNTLAQLNTQLSSFQSAYASLNQSLVLPAATPSSLKDWQTETEQRLTQIQTLSQELTTPAILAATEQYVFNVNYFFRSSLDFLII